MPRATFATDGSSLTNDVKTKVIPGRLPAEVRCPVHLHKGHRGSSGIAEMRRAIWSITSMRSRVPAFRRPVVRGQRRLQIETRAHRVPWRAFKQGTNERLWAVSQLACTNRGIITCLRSSSLNSLVAMGDPPLREQPVFSIRRPRRNPNCRIWRVAASTSNPNSKRAQAS